MGGARTAACRQGGCQGGWRDGGGSGGSSGRRLRRGGRAAAACALAVRGRRRAGEAGNRSAVAGTAVRLWAGPALPWPRRRAPPIGWRGVRGGVRRGWYGGRGLGCAWQAGGEYDGARLDLRPPRRRAPHRHGLVPQLPRGGALPRRRARRRAARTACLRAAHSWRIARLRPLLRAQRRGAPPSTRPAAIRVPQPDPPPSS